jgi:hypothetical protein
MTDKTYLVRFKPPETSTQTVVAAIVEVADDYLWMFKDGDLFGLFAMEVVEAGLRSVPRIQSEHHQRFRRFGASAMVEGWAVRSP